MYDELLPDEDLRYRQFKLLRQEQELDRRRARAVRQESLPAFIRRIWPWFIFEEVHLLLGGYLEAVSNYLIDRLMVFMAPRTGKSRMVSIALPAWHLGRNPKELVMQAGHTADLSVDFGREAKDIMQTAEYQETYPGVLLRADVKAAGKWHTTHGGGYTATGVAGGIAGKGFNLGIIDDPLNEQTARSETEVKRVNDWWGPGFYTRGQLDRNAILITMARWLKHDLAGHVLELAKSGGEYADNWQVVSVPAILDHVTAEMLNELARDPFIRALNPGKEVMRYRVGGSFSPRRYPLPKLLKRKANMLDADWDALFGQKPTSEEGTIIKRKWWRKWRGPLPVIELVIQVYDTAFEEEEMGIGAQGKRKAEPDYSARTTWGVFQHQDHQKIIRPCMILLERWHERVSFPDLRIMAYAAYKSQKGGVDWVLIEKKASGHSLIQELRRKGVPIQEVTISKGSSKTARAHAASVVWQQGCVFYPDRDWTKDVIDECTEFPFGDHDDLTDTCVHAAIWLRRSMWLQLGDEEDEPEEDPPDRRPFG